MENEPEKTGWTKHRKVPIHWVIRHPAEHLWNFFRFFETCKNPPLQRGSSPRGGLGVACLGGEK